MTKIPVVPNVVGIWVPVAVDCSNENALNTFWGEIKPSFWENSVNFWSAVLAVPTLNDK